MTTNDNLRGLKPCPFCGSKKLRTETDDGRHWVLCLGCFAEGPPCSKYSDEDDTEWNTRAALAEPDSGEVVSRQRPNCGCDVHVESCEVCRGALNMAPAKAEPGVKP